jgi:serine protease inhibitor
MLDKKYIIIIIVISTIMKTSYTAESIKNKNTKSASDIDFINNVDNIYSNDSKNKHKGIIISPFSIKCALFPLYFATKGDTLGYFNIFYDNNISLFYDKMNLIKQSSVNIFNSMIINDSIKIYKQYIDHVSKFALITTFNNSNKNNIVDMVNNMARSTTCGKFSNILQYDDIDGQITQIVIVNAIYFKSDWKNKFYFKNTIPDYLFNGIVKFKVNMMTILGNCFKYYENAEFQAIEMDYEDRTITMGIMLAKHVYDKQFTNNDILEAIGNFKNETINILKIPKFKIKCSFDIEPYLSQYGLESLFVDCDLSNMTDNFKNIYYMSKIIHKVHVEVNETGTQAVAITMLDRSGRCIQSAKEEIEFIADHIFTFYIRHIPTNSMLFIGKYQ